MFGFLSPAAPAIAPSWIRAQPGKPFAQSWLPQCRVDLLPRFSVASLSSAPVARSQTTSWPKTKAFDAAQVALGVSAGLPAKNPCPASDPLRRARAFQLAKDRPRLDLLNRANGRVSQSPRLLLVSGRRFGV